MKRTKKMTAFEGIVAAPKEALAYARGEADTKQYRVHIPEDLDVKAIRESAGLTQEVFALRYGFNIGRLRDLGHKRTKPDSVVRAYLLVIQKKPDAVRGALAA